jgi:hypothetical protein
MKRVRPLVFVALMSLLPISASAELHEESIPGQDLTAPTNANPAASASPAAAVNEKTGIANPDSGEWIAVPPGTADPAAPASNPMPPAAQATPATPEEIAPAIDVGSIATTPQVSDTSLAPLIQTAPTPARAASLRITERERVELDRGHTDDAIRELAHAISIDPSNSYAYFYLGRAYTARKNYGQAQTFFKRAQTGLASNSAWLGETYAFEGVSLEQAGKSAEAVAAYQKALVVSPGNLTARVGVTRLAAFLPAAATTTSAPAGDLDQPAPSADIPPPPDEPPPPPAPKSAPPPPAD